MGFLWGYFLTECEESKLKEEQCFEIVSMQTLASECEQILRAILHAPDHT